MFVWGRAALQGIIHVRKRCVSAGGVTISITHSLSIVASCAASSLLDSTRSCCGGCLRPPREPDREPEESEKGRVRKRGVEACCYFRWTILGGPQMGSSKHMNKVGNQAGHCGNSVSGKGTARRVPCSKISLRKSWLIIHLYDEEAGR